MNVTLRNVEYNPNRSWGHRVLDQAYFSLARDIGEHPYLDSYSQIVAGILETAGDAGLWFIEVLPKKIGTVVKEIVTDPRIVTIALTAFALLTNSYLFYPSATRLFCIATIRNITAYLPAITAEQLKFSAWAYITTMIASAGCGRALGRWLNPELKQAYYNLRSN